MWYTILLSSRIWHKITFGNFCYDYSSVVIGHTSIAQISQTVYNWIYSFHMPMFYMLSGMMLNDSKYSDFRSYIKRRLKTLIIPFFCLNTLVWLIVKGLNISHIQTDFTELLTGCLAMYFIRALFVSELWYFFINKLASNWVLKLFIIFLLIVLSDYFRGVPSEYIGLTRNEAIGVILPSMPLFYYAVGHVIRNMALNLNTHEIKYWLVSSVMIVLIIISCLLQPVSYGYFHILPAFCGIIILGLLSILLSRLSVTLLNSTVCFIGRNTLIIVAFHQIIYNSMKILTKYLSLSTVQDATLRLLLLALTLYFLIRSFNKYAPWLVGR
jgi:acyltransferase